MMDEIKHTTDETLQTVAQPAAPAAENDLQEVEKTVDNTPVQAPETTEQAPETEPADNEETNNPAEYLTKAAVIERLDRIIADEGNVERSELDYLKMVYYRIHNAEVVAARESFIEQGGNAEEFIPAPDTEEEGFKTRLAQIKEIRLKAAEALEKTLNENLRRKQEIIESIKQYGATAEDADKGYDEVKKLQAEWKEIGAVPATESTDLWKNYQLYTEQFYDQLRLNHELRAYDFKKNLELKTALCEQAEKLAEIDDPVASFRKLQTLHIEYREIGPVAKEQREEIWRRFKDASTVINKRHQDHFEQIKAREAENLEKKNALCERVEKLEYEGLTTYSQWDEMTKQVLALQAEWKVIGFATRKGGTEAYERFRTACDRFFRTKSAALKANRERQNANLALKQALVEKAEALKDSKDWGATTKQLVELQNEWKKIGSVPQKVSDSIWKQFNTACNYFFKQKNEANATQHKEEEANLALKLSLLEELQKVVEEGADDALQAVRDLQARWNEIGHVPFHKKEKLFRRYRELCDKFYNARHEQAGRRRMENFRKGVANLAGKGGSELSREKARLQNILETKRQEISTYEMNLSFFRAGSKSGNSLIADVEKKIARLKEDLIEIKDKIKTVNEQIKAEETK